jgi:hypothetical protein
MSLAAIIKQEAFDKLPEAIRPEYKKQDDGSYLLDVTPVNDFALENVKGLKSALSAERAAKDTALGGLKAFEGLDAQAARAALEKIKNLGELPTEGKVKEQIEAIKKQLEDKHKGELSAKDTLVSKLTKQLEKLLVESAAMKAISENKGNIELLLPHVRNNVRMKQLENGEFVVEVVDKDGVVRISPATGQTGNMSIAELVQEMKTKDTYAPAFEGTGASGSGATGGGVKIQNGVHVLSQADAKDPLKYRAAKEAAAKAGSQLQIANS